MEDTIAAIATALGEGGIGIVRISGNNALKIAENVFIPAKKNRFPNQGYTVHYGKVVVANKLLDEALLLIMRAPHSYTGEDVAEIHCHGGILPVRRVLHAILESGARLAEPGEFTKRAFLNGRLDLSQAEAVIEIIRSKTDQAMALAANRLNGNLKTKITDLRKKVLGIIAHIEAMVDFPEDDIEELTLDKLQILTKEALAEVLALCRQSGQGKIYQDGVKVAIIGKPNVGKSSLLNALIGENKAIVTHIPGTTRDLIEEWLNIDGIPVRIVDTAGLRDSEDFVEKIGVEKAREAMRNADLVLFVVDVETGITQEDLDTLSALPKERTILLVNKMDLSVEKAQALMKMVDDYETLSISAKEEMGIDALAEKLKIVLTGGDFDLTGEVTVGNIRHLHALERSAENLQEVLAAIEQRLPYDFLSIDLRNAWETLGEISGDAISEDLVEQIFANFCIGK